MANMKSMDYFCYVFGIFFGITTNSLNNNLVNIMKSVGEKYTQYPIIRNGLIRNDAEISVNFKKPAFKGSNLRNA